MYKPPTPHAKHKVTTEKGKLLTYHIVRMLEMMSDAPTNAEKHVMLNIACAHNQ